MKRWWKQAVCIFCAMLFTLQLCPISVGSVLSDVCLIAAGDDLLEPTTDTMPFWEGNRLYIPETVFQGIHRDSLGVFCAIDFDQTIAVLYQYSNEKHLKFDLLSESVTDNTEKTHAVKAIKRNGHVFFPITFVTDFFGLTYSYTPTDTVPLLRLKSEHTILSDKDFISAARNLMRQYYYRYEKQVLSSQQSTPIIPPAIHSGTRVYLAFTVTDPAATQQIVSALASRNMQATFILTAEQMEADGDFLRMLVGTKQGIAIMPTGKTAEESIADIEQASETLWRSSCSVTRLLWLNDAPDSTKTLSDTLGFCEINCKTDNSDAPLINNFRAEALYTRISGLDTRNVTVFMGNDANNISGLQQFLSKLEEGNCRVLAWRETLP